MNIHLVDWIVFAIIFIGLIYSGFYCRKHIKGVSDFVVAGRNVRVFLGLSTGLAEGIGLITISWVMQQGFLYGFGYMWLATIELFLVTVVFGFFGFVIVRFRQGKYMTLPEYFEKRYSKNTRILVGIITAFAGIVNMSIFPIVGSQFLVYFLGIPLHLDIFGLQIPTIASLMVFLIALALTFSFIGGMVSVLVTDFLQSILVAATIVIMLVLVAKNVGFAGLSQGLKSNLGEYAFNPFLSGGYGISFFVWAILAGVFGYCAFAPSMQKVASTNNAKTARAMTMLSSIFNKGRLVMVLLVGMSALIVLGKVPPESSGVSAENWSRVAGPLYLGKLVPPVLMGLILAGLCASFVACVNGYMLGWSSVIVNDVICAIKKTPMTPKVHVRTLRIILLLMAAFLAIFGVFYEPTETIQDYIYLTGTMFTGIGVALVFGLYWKKTSTAGAVSAVLITGIFPTLDLILRRIPNMEYAHVVKSQYTGLATILSAIFGCIMLSILFSNKNQPPVVSNVKGGV